MKIKVLAVIVCMMAAINFASADTIRGIEMDFVTIGDAGNAADTRVMTTDGTSGYGAVGYNYRIGKYEVTNAQWNAFTAAAGVPTGNDGGYGYSAYFTGVQQPTNMVSWYGAAQFCNYLTSGDKSKGAYQFSGDNTNPGNFLGINRGEAISSYSVAYVIPTEDEWYKAAYYRPNSSDYSLYANGTDTAPIAGVQSNYEWATEAPWDITNGTQEQNGTFDMMGNVWEWNETPFYGSNRGLRGGPFNYYDYSIRSSYRRNYNLYYGDSVIGFRVAEIPEPCSLALLLIGGLVLRNRKR